ncbi:hypothetical protein GX50_01035 [[Emmonsia] crescens]|uniref:Uncharacterized protein n=1 Tax=[Emmonsia] crescens TaxID=73230 RepID=A0A2B7ZSL4_9EURO|nr:hypothetical protein GX50_01035 [Emmonsia crescens]
MYLARISNTLRPSTRLLPLTSKSHRIGQRPIHSSRHGRCHDSGNGEEEFSSLSEEQLKQVYAGAYPTDFPREAIRLKTTPQEHSILSDKFNSSESDRGKIKRLRFNRELSATSILHRTTPIHERLVEATRRKLNDHFTSKNVELPFEIYSNLTFYTGFEGDAIRFIPDLAIRSTSRQPFLALEIGVSEKYDDMVETAKLILSKSSNTKYFVIIKILEKPLFRPPLKLSNYLSKPRSDIPIPEAGDPFDADPEGPITINGLKWVGKISAFWEIWGRDASGSPAIKGERVWFYGPNAHSHALKLDLSELGSGCTEVGVESSVLAQAIRKSRAELAVSKALQWLKFSATN